MTAIILTAAMIMTQAPTNATTALDGNWIVISFEKSGETVAETKDCLASIKDNLIVFAPKDKKRMLNPMQLEFGALSTVQVTELVPKAEEASPPVGKKGVYVLTKDYLAISLRDASPAIPGEVAPAADKPKPNAAAFCTVILKRVPVPEPGDKPLK